MTVEAQSTQLKNNVQMHSAFRSSPHWDRDIVPPGRCQPYPWNPNVFPDWELELGLGAGGEDEVTAIEPDKPSIID